jgi:hypothetical protein
MLTPHSAVESTSPSNRRIAVRALGHTMHARRAAVIPLHRPPRGLPPFWPPPG